jgi:hypothetical protein
MNEKTEIGSRQSAAGAGKKNPLTGWTAVIALFGAGVVPCPGCGMPLGWHLWPLALLILAGKWISRRRRTIRGEPRAVPEEKDPPK